VTGKVPDEPPGTPRLQEDFQPHLAFERSPVLGIETCAGEIKRLFGKRPWTCHNLLSHTFAQLFEFDMRSAG